jgi:hypothetical protein
MCFLDWPQLTDFDDQGPFRRAYKGKGFENGDFRRNSQHFRALYNDIAEYSDAYIDEVFHERPVVQRDDEYLHADCAGKYVNIVDGVRFTWGQPDYSDTAVYVLGICHAYGIGADDRYTIASFLQRYVNETVKDNKYLEGAYWRE